MDVYIYQAALYCERCGEAIRAELGNADNPPKSWVECGSCSGYHPVAYMDDCRDDKQRWPSHVTAQDRSDETTYDSDDYPKGPYANGGGEADTPQHCDECQLFLENPLTSDGVAYVREAIAEARRRRRGKLSVACNIWRKFYAEELREA